MLARAASRSARPLLASAPARGLAYAAPSATDAASVRIEFDVPYELHKLEEAPATFTYTSKAELVDYFTQMYRMRRMEIAADTLYKGKYVKGFCHLYDGQEAICVGMEAACTFNDSLVTSYRDHCQQLARGEPMVNVLSELLGKYNPIAKGKGGSMHMYKADKNFFGGNGIVGAQAPIGTGLAFAHKYKQDGGVAMALYGDGAANQGQLYEALNMAALWKLPLIYVCENNQCTLPRTLNRTSQCTCSQITRTPTPPPAPARLAPATPPRALSADGGRSFGLFCVRRRRHGHKQGPLVRQLGLLHAWPLRAGHQGGRHELPQRARGDALRQGVRARARADCDGDGHVPLPRPLDVRPRHHVPES